jgi:hypothetical protein
VIHSDSPFCEIVSRKNYFTTEIVTMDFLLVQLHFTIRQYIREIKIPFEKLLDIINEAYVDERTIHYRIEGENPFIGKHFKLFVEADQYERICRLIKEIE